MFEDSHFIGPNFFHVCITNAVVDFLHCALKTAYST